jgi:hypothetical protein
MARREDPQINVRQPPDRYAILEAAAFVHDKGTPGKLVQGLVDEAIDRYAELASVKKALEARREQAAVDEGKVSRLADTRPRRKRTRGASAGDPGGR